MPQPNATKGEAPTAPTVEASMNQPSETNHQENSVEQSTTQAITPESLPAITWESSKVITTELLARLYGADEKQIRKNFERNRERFEEGKHYHRLVGEELHVFKSSSPVVVQKNTRNLVLWTERGAARHAKMLETDAAWEVFEKLEDCYFAVKTKAAAIGSDPSTTRDRLPLYLFVAHTVVERRLLFSKVYQFLNIFAGTHRFKEMSREQVTELMEFCDRFAIGQDTSTDWRRIVDNQSRLHGTPKQLDMVQQLLIA